MGAQRGCLHPHHALSLGNLGDATRPSVTRMVLNGQEQRLLGADLFGSAAAFKLRPPIYCWLGVVKV